MPARDLTEQVRTEQVRGRDVMESLARPFSTA
jgi:hypothetical protein